MIANPLAPRPQSRSMDLMDIGLSAQKQPDLESGKHSSGGTAYADAIRQITAERVFLCGILQASPAPCTACAVATTR